MSERDTLSLDSAVAHAWRGFKPGAWQQAIDLRSFIQTNMTPWSFRQVFMALPSLKGNKIQADMVPGNFANIGGVSYWAPDPEETRKVVERLFIAPPQPQPPPEEKK